MAGAFAIGCASGATGNRIAPCIEVWSREADEQALDVFLYDVRGRAQANRDLEARVDYLDGYCRAANAALGTKAPERPWWRRLWGGS